MRRAGREVSGSRSGSGFVSGSGAYSRRSRATASSGLAERHTLSRSTSTAAESSVAVGPTRVTLRMRTSFPESRLLEVKVA